MFRQALRAPRVAIVVDGDGPWQHWARLALDAVSGIWAGAGFVLVPHRGGTVRKRILQAAAAYDPDYVVLFRPTLRQYDAALPDSFPLVVDGVDAAPDLRAELLGGDFGSTPLDDPPGETARDQVFGDAGGPATAARPHRTRPTGRPTTDKAAGSTIKVNGGSRLRACGRQARAAQSTATSEYRLAPSEHHRPSVSRRWRAASYQLHVLAGCS